MNIAFRSLTVPGRSLTVAALTAPGRSLTVAALTVAALWVAVLLGGCATPGTLENSARLMARPDFPAAAQAAPEWARDALKTINRLEYEIEKE